MSINNQDSLDEFLVGIYRNLKELNEGLGRMGIAVASLVATLQESEPSFAAAYAKHCSGPLAEKINAGIAAQGQLAEEMIKKLQR